MKKHLFVCFLAIVCLFVFCACRCEHQFADADCVTPKTCSKCGETEGEALGHTWADADCVTAKTCTVCKATEGEALGHTWVDADCVTAKTCSVCAATEGEALGHTWAEATCAAPQTCTVCAVTEGDPIEHTWVDATTEAPKTCSVCAATEGERIITDERFTTASCAPLFGSWKGVIEMPAYACGISDSEDPVVFDNIFEFGNDGVLTQRMTMANVDAVKQMLGDYLKETLYAEFESQGISKDKADAAFIMSYGVTITQYVDSYVESVPFEDPGEEKMVYYVQDGKLYMAYSWDDVMEGAQFLLEGDTLKLTYDDGMVLTWTRVTEE